MKSKIMKVLFLCCSLSQGLHLHQKTFISEEQRPPGDTTLLSLSSSTSPDSEGGDVGDNDVLAFSTLLAVGADMKKVKHEGNKKK